ncbi:thiol-disulfide oxidoreductase DCC family protein [Virgibacillus ndiopensis]|uniref:thiol-disulfide oxidoreductase DCC family protein n=1 Tax=Virgibacillus ndiopensis TaxID=2004408 RepID=UPI000C079145|nr:DUF393 domain-containing protein [Virgibacillus ndiopensis]
MLIIYYDGFCKMCSSTSVIWKKIDWSNQLAFESFRTLNDYPKAMEESLHVNKNGHWYTGYNAIIQISKKLPLMWVLLPFLYLFKLIGLGDFVYNKVAKNRKLVPVNQCGEDGCMLPPSQD